MDAQLEALVQLYLTRGGSVFINPQYSVVYGDRASDGEAVPDIVALDFKAREVIIAEVTSAWNISGLCGRIVERKTRWYEPIRKQMLEDRVIDADWEFRTMAFVREAKVATGKDRFPDPDVCFLAIENCSFMYDYWDERLAKPLPGSLRRWSRNSSRPRTETAE